MTVFFKSNSSEEIL